LVTPNPVRGEITIRIALSPQKTPSSEPILRLYNIAGRLVKEFAYPASHSSRSWNFVWDGRDEFKKNSPSGVYILKLEAGHYSITEKLLLIR
jgi:flagellar hook assembly protein FlgD